MKETEQIKKDLSELWEKHRLSSRPKLWKFDKLGRYTMELLISELVRESKKEFAKRLRDWGLIILKDLQPREQKILEMIFIEFKSLDEVGQEFGVTRERIIQIEFKALEKLRSHDCFAVRLKRELEKNNNEIERR